MTGRAERMPRLLAFLLFVLVPSASAQNINKCCSGGEQFNEYLKCASVDEKGSTSGITNRFDIDIEYDKFNFSTTVGVIPCSRPDYIVRSFDWFKFDESGNLHLQDDPGNVVAMFTKKSYCVERWNMGAEGFQDIAYLCPCMEHLCIRKCCEEDRQIYLQTEDDGKTSRFCGSVGTGAENWHHSVLNGLNITKYHEMIYGDLDCGDRPQLQLSGKYSLQEDGSIDSVADGIIQPEDYCGDFTWSGNGTDRVGIVLACVVDVDDDRTVVRLVFFTVLSTIGELFLLLTIVLHVWLPELAGLNARCLVAHTVCLLLGFICNTLLQMYVTLKHPYTCQIIGYLMQFFFLASFFWLNIMCVTMSYTFSALRPSKGGSQRERDRRRFLWYSAYAWGCTAAFTIAALAVDFSPSVPVSSPFKPNLGKVKCWFNSTGSLLLYFYGPMGILLLANLFLFIYTTWRIVVLSRGSDALRQGDSARHGGPQSSKEKQRYILYAKMFSLMGVTWLTEILSWAIGGPSYIWYITDFINLLRAVFIFIIFCWKPRVWSAVKRKFAHIKSTTIKALGFKRNEEQITTEHSEPSTDSSTMIKSTSVRLEMKPPPK